VKAARIVHWSVTVVVTAAILFGLSRASAVPAPLRAASTSELRLSWSARPQRIEVCRTLSPEELAQREEHMRQRVECTGRFATYALRVDADDATLHESIVHGGGLRHDRPIDLLREITVTPGAHRLRVRFARREVVTDTQTIASAAPSAVDTGLFAGRAQREAVERERRVRAAIPPLLVLDTTIAFPAGRVLVVTLDAEHAALRLLDGRAAK
jgi:hypothetical protein